MAQFRIDQSSPGAGTPGVSRHDLVPNEVISLVATSPVGPGVTYAWEILDKVGSAAALTSSTGASTSIGPANQITEPCAFRVRLTANDNGTVTETVRVFSVVTPNLALRIPLFAETAPASNKLGANDPDLSDDNAVYPNRAGLGVSEKNWRGWAEWAYLMTVIVDGIAGGGVAPSGPAGGDLGSNYPNPAVVGLRGVPINIGAATPSPGQALIYDGTDYKPTTISGNRYATRLVGNAANGDTSSMCDILDSGDGVGLEQAIAEVDAAGGGEVVVLPGTYDLTTGGVVTPITIPDGVKVRCLKGTTISARMAPDTGESMSVFVVEGELEDCEIFVDGPSTENDGTETFFVDVADTGRVRRVTMSFGVISAGQHTDFGTIREAFRFTHGSVLEDVTVQNAPSFRNSGAAYDFSAFASTGSFSREPFRLVRCKTTGVSLTRGGDIGFNLQHGMGYVDGPVVINARRIGVVLGASAEGVRLSVPEIMWTAADNTTGRTGIYFGDETNNALCLDNEIQGGYLYGDTADGTAVRMRCGINGSVKRNKVHGVTLRGWDTGVDLIGFGGTVGANSFQFNVIRDVGTPLSTDGSDTETVFDNNVTDTSLGA